MATSGDHNGLCLECSSEIMPRKHKIHKKNDATRQSLDCYNNNNKTWWSCFTQHHGAAMRRGDTLAMPKSFTRKKYTPARKYGSYRNTSRYPARSTVTEKALGVTAQNDLQDRARTHLKYTARASRARSCGSRGLRRDTRTAWAGPSLDWTELPLPPLPCRTKDDETEQEQTKKEISANAPRVREGDIFYYCTVRPLIDELHC